MHTLTCPCRMVRRSAIILLVALVLPIHASATFISPAPTRDGAISSGEYGNHTNEANQWSDGSRNWYMNWDDTYLYVAVVAGNSSDELAIYIDTDPQTPVNGGSNSNGTNSGISFDGDQFATLPFRANFLAYIRDDYHQHRTSDGSGGWSSNVDNSGSILKNNGNTREVAIAWSLMGGRPSSFNFMIYLQGTDPYGGTVGTPGGGTSLVARRYFSISDSSNSSSSTLPFARESYVNPTSTDSISGTFYDVTANSSNTLTINGDLTVKNSLRVESGSTVQASGTRTVTLNGDAGSLVVNGTLNPNNGVGNDVRLTVDGTITLQGSASASSFALYDITINAGKTLQAPSSGTVAVGLQYGTLTVNGTLNFVNGSGAVNATLLDKGGGGNTVTLTDGTAGTATFNNLTISSNATLQPNTSDTAMAYIKGAFENNGTFNRSNSSGLLNVTFNGSSEQELKGSSTTVFNNLTVNSSATALITTQPKVEGALTNNGALKQTQTVNGTTVEFLHIKNNAGTSDKYLGVDINPGSNNMGSTGVTIYGNQSCAQPPNIGSGGTLILRCYTITPATTANATTKFWYDTTYERNGLSQSAVQIFHEEISPALWRLQGDRTDGSSGSDNFRYVQVSTTSYSRFAGGVQGTNLIALASFTAAPLVRGVLLTWDTASELDTAGFNLWRGDAADGSYARVNATLIPATGGPTWGASYTFTDATVANGATYYYKLEVVDIYGQSAFHGPMTVTTGAAQGRRYLPIMVR